MTETNECQQVEEIIYKRDFISYDRQPLYRYRLQIFGIKSECCKNFKNICYTKNNDFLKCRVCNRLFTWKRIKEKESIKEIFVVLGVVGLFTIGMAVLIALGLGFIP